MSEINFLSDELTDEESNKKDKGQKNKNGKSTTHDSEVNTNAEGDYGLEDYKKDKERIEKSREEVLEMIDKKKPAKSQSKKSEKKPDLPAAGKVKSDEKKSWLSSLFSSKKDKKDDKKASVDHSAKKEDDNLEKEAEEFDKLSKDIEKKREKERNEKKYIVPQEDQIKKVKEAKDSPYVFSDKTWKSAGVLGTNLIDQNEYSYIDPTKKLKYLLVGVFASLIIVLGSYLALLYWEDQEIRKLISIKEDIRTEEVEVLKLEKTLEEPRLFQTKLDIAAQLLSKHIYWTNFFSFLESKTLKEIYYKDGFKGTVGDIFTMEGRCEDFTQVKNQLVVYANSDEVVDLQASSIGTYRDILGSETLGDGENVTERMIFEEGVSFDLNLEVDRNIFYKSDSSLEEDNIE